MHHRKMPAGRASLHRRQRHAIDRLMPFTGAPLFHALQLLATSDSARFHMPGHKGTAGFQLVPRCFRHRLHRDLRHGKSLPRRWSDPRRRGRSGALFRRERLLFFLTGGSTQGILAMLGAAVGRGGSVLIDREVHRSVCHGCALLDITPYFFSAPLLEPFGITGALARRGRRASAARPSRHPRRPAHLAHLLRPAPRPSGLRRPVPRTRKAAARRRSSRRALPGGRPAFSGRGGRGYGRALHAQDHALSRAGGCAALRTGHRPRVPAREHRPVRHFQPLLPHHGLDRPRTRIQ